MSTSELNPDSPKDQYRAFRREGELAHRELRPLHLVMGWVMFIHLVLIRSGWTIFLVIAFLTVAYAISMVHKNRKMSQSQKRTWQVIYVLCGFIFWMQFKHVPQTPTIEDSANSGIEETSDREKSILTTSHGKPDTDETLPTVSAPTTTHSESLVDSENQPSTEDNQGDPAHGAVAWDETVDFYKLGQIDMTVDPQGQPTRVVRENPTDSTSVIYSVYIGKDKRTYKHGIEEHFFMPRDGRPEGKVRHIQWVYGAKHGQSFSWSYPNLLLLEENYFRNEYDGPITIFGADQHPSSIAWYQNGIKHGTATWYLNGNKSREERYWQGRLMDRSYYSFQGRDNIEIREVYDKSGLITKGRLINQKKEGIWKTVNQKGEVVKEESYQSGVLIR